MLARGKTPAEPDLSFSRFPQNRRGYSEAHERRPAHDGRNDVAIYPDPAPARQKAAVRKTTAARKPARKKATERGKTAVTKPAPKEGDSQKR